MDILIQCLSILKPAILKTQQLTEFQHKAKCLDRNKHQWNRKRQATWQKNTVGMILYANQKQRQIRSRCSIDRDRHRIVSLVGRQLNSDWPRINLSYLKILEIHSVDEIHLNVYRAIRKSVSCKFVVLVKYVRKS